MRARMRNKRQAGLRRRTLTLVLAIGVPLAALGVASPALASNPYSVFEQCPTKTAGVHFCLYGTTTKGEFAIGKTKVPINKTIVLQGGALPTEPSEASGAYYLIPAKNGESLSKTELNVPGGLLDLINCEEIKGNGLIEVIAREACKAVFENKETGVTATTELVATSSNPAILSLHNLFAESGTALTLPVRLHLKNPLLGNSCYIGSESHPVQLHLTTGITSPPGPEQTDRRLGRRRGRRRRRRDPDGAPAEARGQFVLGPNHGRLWRIPVHQRLLGRDCQQQTGP